VDTLAPLGGVLSYSSRSRRRLSRRARGRVLRLSIRGEDAGKRRHSLNQVTNRSLLDGLGLHDGRGGICGLETSGFRDKEGRFVGVRELISVTGDHVWLNNGKAMHYANSDGVGEAFEIGSIAFAFREAILGYQVGSDGEEATIVFPELFPVHLAQFASALDESRKVVVGVSSSDA
jgi:hypothetical protein